MTKRFAAALDGPSGAGKSTVAKAAAARLGILYVDTGAMYRAVGLAVLRRGIGEDDAAGIEQVLPEITVTLRHGPDGQRVFLSGEDVSDAIRNDRVAQYASKCSAVPAVRAFLLDAQRALARENSVIMDGRDIGTVVLPDAEVKIFLTASVEARAQRRYHELQERGQDVTLEGVRADIERRDSQDRNRPIAPLRQAGDAVLLDTSSMTLEASIDAVLRLITGKTGVGQ
ncbi:MAG: (d)CMP kinase [Clostridiaceae bacterium]|nr:(d)CMP kinase [Clostridiaceae bacterium]MCI9483914.1 (d)CMP kinase [Clostridiaceae bacterium]